MIIVMKQGADEDQLRALLQWVEELGFGTHVSQGEERVIVGLIGDERPLLENRRQFERLAGVERVIPILRPYKLASRDFHPEDSEIMVGDQCIGGRRIAIVAGPCAVENRDQLLEIAWAVREAGATFLRGGAFKPRTSPYSFQGLGEVGLEILAEAGQATGLGIITEVMAAEQVPLVAQYADILQVGTRNMQNYSLLHAVGESKKPVLLKRGWMSTLEELLMSAEYILSHSNRKVILCERGIRTFETYTRNTLDISAVPALKGLCHLPVTVDPSHGTGRWHLVGPMARAAVAAGADGLMIEVHPHPESALSDGAQSLRPGRFNDLMAELREVAQAVGRDL